jgi:hypothetical protein
MPIVDGSFRNVGWTSGGAVTTGALLLPAD